MLTLGIPPVFHGEGANLLYVIVGLVLIVVAVAAAVGLAVWEAFD